MRAFEIHTYTKGRWKIDSVFDDRELAVFEAKRMDGSGRYTGVRVVEETFDEKQQKSTIRTIFRGSKATQANEQQVRQAKQNRRKALTSEQRRVQQIQLRKRARLEKKKKRRSNPLRLAVIMTVLVLSALAALYGLQHAKSLL